MGLLGVVGRSLSHIADPIALELGKHRPKLGTKNRTFAAWHELAHAAISTSVASTLDNRHATQLVRPSHMKFDWLFPQSYATNKPKVTRRIGRLQLTRPEG
jgi:hypothetical protein